MRKRILVALVALLVALGGFVSFYLYGPCGVLRVNRAAGQMDLNIMRWNDAMTLYETRAEATGALTQLVARLQALKAETRAMEVPHCLVKGQQLELRWMEHAIESLVLTSQLGGIDPIDPKGDFLRRQAAVATEEITRAKACAPFCGFTP